MFFFEKKNQKTFESLSRTVLQRLPEDIKVFCFFFSKKKTFSSLACSHRPRRAACFYRRMPGVWRMVA